MTTTANAPGLAGDGTISLTKVRTRSWKAPITFTVATFLVFLMAFPFGRSGESSFRFSVDRSDPGVPLPTAPWVIGCFVVVLLLTALSWYLASQYRSGGLAITIPFAVVAVFGFLVWSAAGGLVPVVGMLSTALSLSVPLVFGALGGVIGERVGVVNVAIEAQFLLAAFTSALIGSITGNYVLGLLGAIVAGMLVAVILAVFAIQYVVEQVIIGVVLNVLITGLTSFLHGAIMVPNKAGLNTPPPAPKLPIPLLDQIPVIGPVLFNQSLIVYLMYVIVPLVAWGLYRTKWGLRLRAVGEHPKAADTVGIKVNPTRFWNVLLAGGIAGLGGAYFTLGAGLSFDKEMTNGLGFIALAAVIFGGWDPVKATFAALLFGFATSLKTLLQNLESPVPSEFMSMLPYLVTILAVVGFAGKMRAPAASGKPYIKG